MGLLHTLATLPQHPESVPVNALLAVKGTPLENQEPVSVFEMVRMIATARIVMPKSMVRLSAGRVRFSMAEQAMCFMAGANSIFTGDKLLTTPNNEFTDDQKMFEILGKRFSCYQPQTAEPLTLFFPGLVPKPPNFQQGSDNPNPPNYENGIKIKAEVAA